jgi:hypothetical protein
VLASVPVRPALTVPPITCLTVFTVIPLAPCPASQVVNALKVAGVVDRSAGQSAAPMSLQM